MAPISEAPRTSGELMSSIAAVRELLKKDFSSEGQAAIADELSTVKESKYQQKLQYETEIEIYKETIEDLKEKVERLQQEMGQERKIRKSLEATNAALEAHAKDLNEKLESHVPSSNEAIQVDAGDATTKFALQEENKKLKGENDSLAKQISEAKEQNEDAIRTAIGWEARCVAAQRQVKGLQTELATVKRELQIHEERYTKEIEKHASTCDSFKKRLEESMAARQKAELNLKLVGGATKTGASSNEKDIDQEQLTQLKQRCQKAEEDLQKASEKVETLEINLAVLRRGRSKAELKKEKDAKEKVSLKIASLNVSFNKMSENAEKFQKELEALEKDTSQGAVKKIEEKREALLLEKSKVGAILESVESQLKDRLAIQKRKVEDTTAELERVKKDLLISKKAVNDTQQEITQLEKRMADMVKAINLEVVGKGNVNATKETPKEAVSPKKASAKMASIKKVPISKPKSPTKKRQPVTETAEEGGKRRKKGK